MSCIARLSQQLAILIPLVNDESFPDRLVELFQALIPADDIFIVVYDPSGIAHCKYSLVWLL